MSNYPYPTDPVNSQMTDYIPPLPELPQRQIPMTPIVNEDADSTDTGIDLDAQQQEAPGQTLAFVIGKVNDFLQWFAITLVIILLLRFFLMLIGADPSNIFASFIYALTTVILVPFNGIVTNPSFRANQAFEWSTLIGMAIYALIFWLLRWLVRITISPPKPAE